MIDLDKLYELVRQGLPITILGVKYVPAKAKVVKVSAISDDVTPFAGLEITYEGGVVERVWGFERWEEFLAEMNQ